MAREARRRWSAASRRRWSRGSSVGVASSAPATASKPFARHAGGYAAAEPERDRRSARRRQRAETSSTRPFERAAAAAAAAPAAARPTTVSPSRSRRNSQPARMRQGCFPGNCRFDAGRGEGWGPSTNLRRRAASGRPRARRRRPVVSLAGQTVADVLRQGPRRQWWVRLRLRMRMRMRADRDWSRPDGPRVRQGGGRRGRGRGRRGGFRARGGAEHRAPSSGLIVASAQLQREVVQALPAAVEQLPGRPRPSGATAPAGPRRRRIVQGQAPALPLFAHRRRQAIPPGVDLGHGRRHLGARHAGEAGVDPSTPPARGEGLLLALGLLVLGQRLQRRLLHAQEAEEGRSLLLAGRRTLSLGLALRRRGGALRVRARGGAWSVWRRGRESGAAEAGGPGRDGAGRESGLIVAIVAIVARWGTKNERSGHVCPRRVHWCQRVAPLRRSFLFSSVSCQRRLERRSLLSSSSSSSSSSAPSDDCRPVDRGGTTHHEPARHQLGKLSGAMGELKFRKRDKPEVLRSTATM